MRSAAVAANDQPRFRIVPPPRDKRNRRRRPGDLRPVAVLLAAIWLLAADYAIAERPEVSFRQGEGRLHVLLGEEQVATYVYDDPKLPRPYFCDLKLGGIALSRNHPPREGEDATDHAEFHPGLWMSFGDLNGHDYWRNKAVTRHTSIGQPLDGQGAGNFAVSTDYMSADGMVIASEGCRFLFAARDAGLFLYWDSVFAPEEEELVFGDQEEMGLGLRIATPLAVDNGGEIVDSEGRKNGAEVWGKNARWCAYRGNVEGRHVGVAIFDHPKNFRPAWWHARDYGLLVANPFGQKAFTGGELSRKLVPQGNQFRLSYGILLFNVAGADELDLEAEAAKYAGLRDSPSAEE